MSIGAETPGIYVSQIQVQYDGTSVGDICIEKLNDAGVTTETYWWFCNARGKEDGWYNDDEQLIGSDDEEIGTPDILIPAGEGLWVTGLEDGVMPFAGEVFEADKSIPLADNKQMLANPYPCDLPLSASIWVDYDGTSVGDICIEKLNDAGVTTETYWWFCNARGKEDGWYNDDEQLIGSDDEEIGTPEIVFPASTGLWVTGLEDATFKITSPLK